MAASSSKEGSMRGRKTSLVVILTDAEFQQLQKWSRSATTAVGLVRRANAILAVHTGQTVKQAAKSSGLSETHTRKWLKRFLQHRLAGLQDLARPGRPPAFSP
jgi:hypothetical protein